MNWFSLFRRAFFLPPKSHSFPSAPRLEDRGAALQDAIFCATLRHAGSGLRSHARCARTRGECLSRQHENTREGKVYRNAPRRPRPAPAARNEGGLRASEAKAERRPKPSLNCRAGFEAHLRPRNAEHARAAPAGACWVMFYLSVFLLGGGFEILFNTV